MKNMIISEINYTDLLQTEKWKSFRLKIKKRDKFRCKICKIHESELSNGEKLHVHHTCYKNNVCNSSKEITRFKPWEYPEEDLITVCERCHEELHTKHIPILDQYNQPIEDLVICYRCNGIGYFPKWYYIQRGECFKCNGHQYIYNGFKTLKPIF